MFPGIEDRAAHLNHHSTLANQCRAIERQCGATEGALRHRAADIPMCPAATRAMVRLMLAIDHMIAAYRRIVGINLAGFDHTRHATLPSLTHARQRTTGSKGFMAGLGLKLDSSL